MVVHRLLLLTVLLLPLALGGERPLALAGLSILAALGLLFLPPANQLINCARLNAMSLPFWVFIGISSLSVLYSPNSSQGLIALMTLATYACLFLAGLHTAQRASQFYKALLAIATGLSLYGLVTYAQGNTHILWLEKQAYLDSLTATFINRNAFAAYASMALIVALALLTDKPCRTGNGRFFLVVCCSCLLATALLLSHSRAGILSALFGLLTLATLLIMNRVLSTRKLAMLLLPVLLFALTIFAYTGDRLAQRSQWQELARDDRPQIWLITLKMISDHPLTGAGLGSYPSEFQHYRTPEIKQNYTRAHNTWLETAAETGLVSLLCALTAGAALARRLYSQLISPVGNKLPVLIAVSVGVQALIHTLVDFSFQTPANAAILAIILAMGCAAPSESYPASPAEESSRANG